MHATRFAIEMKKKNGTNGNHGTNGACEWLAPIVPFFFLISIDCQVAWK
jgi:hypothetical protein